MDRVVNSAMDHSLEDRSRPVTRSKARLGHALTIPMSYWVESEVGLCIDHSGRSGDRKRGWVVH